MTDPNRATTADRCQALPAWAAAEPELYAAPTGEHRPVAPRRSRQQQTHGRIQDRDQFAADWIAALRSGRHRQARGVWGDGDSACVNKVAVNELGVTVGDLRDAYGATAVNEFMYRNDVEKQSFREIASLMDRTVRRGRAVELER